jgi:hypothetical protein
MLSCKHAMWHNIALAGENHTSLHAMRSSTLHMAQKHDNSKDRYRSLIMLTVLLKHPRLTGACRRA